MIDELTIYNLYVKYPNTVDLVREVEKMVRADAIDEFVEFYQTVDCPKMDCELDEDFSCIKCLAKVFKEQKK